jgi:hypothetical protein
MIFLAWTPTALAGLLSRSSSGTGVEHTGRAADENCTAKFEKKHAGREPKPLGTTSVDAT